MTKKKECFQSTIGGQALIEGIYMRGPEKSAIAVRKPDGEIFIETEETVPSKLKDVPFLRGAALMVQSLTKGYKSIMKAAEIAGVEEGEPSKFDLFLERKLGDKGVAFFGIVSAVLAAFLSIALFFVLPTFLTGLIDRFLPLFGWKAVIEGILKIVLFVLYLLLISRMGEIKRVFAYHGAEHKTIACYEARDELTIEKVRNYSRFHPRCGTNFLFLVLMVSILLFSFVPFNYVFLRALIKVLLIPVVMGIAYEILRYSGRHSNLLARFFSAPGIWLQRLTTLEPDDGQIEIAITALLEVIPAEGEVDDSAVS